MWFPFATRQRPASPRSRSMWPTDTGDSEQLTVIHAATASVGSPHRRGETIGGDRGGMLAHPLDPLDADEIRHVATALLEKGCGPALAIRLDRTGRSQAKGESAASGTAGIGRAAHVICWNTADGHAYRALVSLPAGDITRWEQLPGLQPSMTVDEWHECDEMLRRHPALIAALARREITDMSLVLTDVWAYGAALVPARYRGLRLGWADVWARGKRGRQPLRASRHRPASHRRPEPDGAAGAGGRLGRRRPGSPRGDGRIPARADPGAAA